MSEFKVGDNVEVKPESKTGEIKKITGDGRDYYVKYNATSGYWAYKDELELIPEYKTLAELWEESDKEPFKAECGQVRIFVFGICYCERPDALYLRIDQESEGYQDILADQSKWQLYQEPEEKPAEKCEHDNYSGGDKGWYCDSCGVELVEKWLWYYTHVNEPRLWVTPLTEKEARGIWKHSIIKKATWSRELFEVGE